VSVITVSKVLSFKKGEGIATAGRIPEDGEFFQDHFPDFPILPGVLAVELLKQSAECYLEGGTLGTGRKRTLKQLRDVKFSSYLKPGAEWEAELTLVSEQNQESSWRAKLLHAGRLACSARFILTES